jgi:hypothetical protein
MGMERRVAMSLTTYTQTKILDHILRASSFGAIATPYLGLFTVEPADDGTGGTEVTGGGYARLAGAFAADTDGVTYNTGVLTWDVPACTVVAGGIFDAVSGGNLLWIARFAVSRTVLAGTFSLQVGDWVVQLG